MPVPVVALTGFPSAVPWRPWHERDLGKIAVVSLVVRPEHRGDEAAIFAVTRDAFASAEHCSGTEQFIVSALRKRGALTVSLVAVAEEVVVGHAAVSPVTIDSRSVPADSDMTPSITGWYGLGPVSVLPDHQGKGVGTALVKRALEAIVREQGCVVLGDPDYYGRFGFRSDPRLVLPEVPSEFFQVLQLTSSEIPHGTVTYDQAFDVKD